MIVTSIERTKKTPEGRKHGKSSWEREEREERGRKEGRRRTVSPLEKSQREISRPDYKVVFVKSKKRFTTGEGCCSGSVAEGGGNSLKDRKISANR